MEIPSILDSVEAASKEVKVDFGASKLTKSANSTANATEAADEGMAVLITGATHARELLSS